jgi:hypothetical protein
MAQPLPAPLARLAALPLALCLLAACGGTGEDPLQAGVTKLSAGDYAGAAALLEQAAKSQPAGSPSFKQASLALAQARAHLDPKLAFSEFSELLGQHPQLIQAEDVARVANALSDVASGILPAAQLVDQYTKEYPDTAAAFAPIKQKIDARKNDVPDSDRKMLESLGYL